LSLPASPIRLDLHQAHKSRGFRPEASKAQHYGRFEPRGQKSFGRFK
jgi:hypothetical protein